MSVTSDDTMWACVAGWWNITVNRSNSVRLPASGRASTSASKNSGSVGFDGGKVGELADLLPDDDAEVPQGVQESMEKPLIGGSNRTFEKNEQVDIRPQTQLAAAVPAECDGGDRLRRGRRRLEQIPQQCVDTRRVLARARRARHGRGSSRRAVPRAPIRARVRAGVAPSRSPPARPEHPTWGGVLLRHTLHRPPLRVTCC